MILAIDPGLTTGWALVSTDWEVKSSGGLAPENLDELNPRNLPPLIGVIIEDTPIPTYSQLDRKLQEIQSTLRSWFPEAQWIRPGVWKNHPVAHEPLEKSLSPHQKDAIRMAFYFLATHDEVTWQ